MKLRKGKRISSATIDNVDQGIIDILTANGRATNQEIAASLGITPATVATRLSRMEEQKLMRVVTVTDFSAFGYNVLIAVGIRVFGRGAEDVARDLAKLPEVFSLNIMHGSYDIEMLVVLHEFEEIRMFLSDHVASIEGIYELSPGIAADITKFEFHVAPL